MHVLSLPPAFVLSQDQTLKLTSRPSGPESPDGAHQKGPSRLINAGTPSLPRASGRNRKTTRNEAPYIQRERNGIGPQTENHDEPSRTDRSPARKDETRSLPKAAAPASRSRRPRIPSLTTTMSISLPKRPLGIPRLTRNVHPQADRRGTQSKNPETTVKRLSLRRHANQLLPDHPNRPRHPRKSAPPLR